MKLFYGNINNSHINWELEEFVGHRIIFTHSKGGYLEEICLDSGKKFIKAGKNTFEIELEDITREEEAFRLVFNIGNFKFINGDYDVSITKKLISHFKHTKESVEYWVALEKNSSYGD